MATPKKIQLVARIANSKADAVELTKPQIIVSNLNTFSIESPHPVYQNQVLELEDGSDYESLVSVNDGTVRKRKRLNNLTLEEKIMRRKIKNREAAQTARDRKKQKMIELERTIISLESLNKQLTMENNTLKNCTEALLDENKRLKSQLNISPNGVTLKSSKMDNKPQIIHIKKRDVAPIIKQEGNKNNDNMCEISDIASCNSVKSDTIGSDVLCFTTPSEVSEFYDVVTTELDQVQKVQSLVENPSISPKRLKIPIKHSDVKRTNLNQMESHTPNDIDKSITVCKTDETTTSTNNDNDETSRRSASRALIDKSAALVSPPLQWEMSCLLTIRLVSLVSTIAFGSITLCLLLALALSKEKVISMPQETQTKRLKVILPRRKPSRSMLARQRLRRSEKRPMSLKRWWGRHQKNWNPTGNL